MVIICHSTETIYPLSLAGIEELGAGSKGAAFTLFTIGRLGVPLFLFISGYLMLDRQYDKQACFKFWKTKWAGLLIATESWIIIYNVFLCYTDIAPFDPVTLVKNMLFLEKIPRMGHLWYMPMIIGLYLFLPFIANGLKWLDSAKLLAFPLCIACSILFLIPIASIMSQSLGMGELNCSIAPGFSGGYYGCYLLLGYCVKKGLRTHKGITSLIGLTAFAATVSLQLFAYGHGVHAPVWYSNGFLLVAGFSIFLLFAQAKGLRITQWVLMLSQYSFALYLVHPPIKILVAPLIEKLDLPLHFLQVAVLTIVVLAISLIVCLGIARIPKVGKRILYMR